MQGGTGLLCEWLATWQVPSFHLALEYTNILVLARLVERAHEQLNNGDSLGLGMVVCASLC